MKKIQLSKGLQINKEAVSALQNEQMKVVKGGKAAAYSCLHLTCNGHTRLE